MDLAAAGLHHLRTRLEELAAAHSFAGVALVEIEGEVVFASAAGLASRRHGLANTIDTRFHVASVTKMLTATAAMSLVEDGALRLDGPLGDVLPREHQPRALTREHSLRHLLSHTSGLANYHDDETTASWIAAMDRVGVRRARTPADMLPLFRDLDPVAPPGGEVRYADANYQLVGLVLEAATGQRFDQVIAERVMAPAGMHATSFTDLDLDPVGLATGYQVVDGPYETWPTNIHVVPNGCMPDGGMITTANDLARFLDALLGGRLVSEESVRGMSTPHGTIRDGLEAYGLGLELYVEDDGRVSTIGHAGGDPGVSAMVTHHVDERANVIVLCNQDRGSWATANVLTDALGIREPRE